jgi:hypothetical protein
MSAPRGLTNFIRDIRNCASKEDETKRVNLELANIRNKFKQSDKLSSYDRKKCVQPQPMRVAASARHLNCVLAFRRQVCLEAAVHLHARLRGRVRSHGGACMCSVHRPLRPRLFAQRC